eukprot:2426126-Pleurochrysis_carterae.AAC.4
MKQGSRRASLVCGIGDATQLVNGQEQRASAVLSRGGVGVGVGHEPSVRSAVLWAEPMHGAAR